MGNTTSRRLGRHSYPGTLASSTSTSSTLVSKTLASSTLASSTLASKTLASRTIPSPTLPARTAKKKQPLRLPLEVWFLIIEQITDSTALQNIYLAFLSAGLKLDKLPPFKDVLILRDSIRDAWDAFDLVKKINLLGGVKKVFIFSSAYTRGSKGRPASKDVRTSEYDEAFQRFIYNVLGAVAKTCDQIEILVYADVDRNHEVPYVSRDFLRDFKSCLGFSIERFLEVGVELAGDGLTTGEKVLGSSRTEKITYHYPKWYSLIDSVSIPYTLIRPLRTSGKTKGAYFFRRATSKCSITGDETTVFEKRRSVGDKPNEDEILRAVFFDS